MSITTSEVVDLCEFYIDFRNGVAVPADEPWVSGFDYSGDVRVYCEQEAPIAVKGDSDSFGTEWLHFCRGCYAQVQEEMHAAALKARIGKCAACKHESTTLGFYYDPTECGCGGSCCGAMMCLDCRSKARAAAEAEWTHDDDNDVPDYTDTCDNSDGCGCDDCWIADDF